MPLKLAVFGIGHSTGFEENNKDLAEEFESPSQIHVRPVLGGRLATEC
jgi:hypothetical protein